MSWGICVRTLRLPNKIIFSEIVFAKKIEIQFLLKLVIALFTILILRILILSEKQTSRFSRIVGYSLSSILFAHILINISMTIGLMPVIGIPLPFFSYGGSALLSFSILLFMFIKLDTYRIERF